jgi:glycosyltransferase involved in cell wall biosynthesis
MFKICHVITSLDVGGAEVSLLQLLSGMDKDRFSCSVISLIAPGRVGRRMRESGIEVRSLGLRRGAASRAGLLRLVRWLRQDRPNALMTWLYHADLLGLTAGKIARVPAIVWNVRSADADMSRYPLLSAWTLRLCVRLSHLPCAIVVNSERGRAWHEGLGYRPREWVVIPNGVDPARFRPDVAAREEVRRELGLRERDLLIGLVARFDPMKDHESFVAAARCVAQADESVQFLLAGTGIDHDNRILAAGLEGPPFAGRVHLLGERDDIPRLMAAMDIACSSSLSEAFPNTVAEAMACGVVCVATDAGDAARIVGETGIIVPPGNPEALSQGLLRAVAMGPAWRHMMGQAARERVVQKFGLERSVAEYENFFARIGSQ